jgi:Family of unknown function (DUF6527)
MNQVSSVLRRDECGYDHWCPGCQEMHHLPDGWKFNGNLQQPSFTPSFKHQGLKREFVNGKWSGQWLRDSNGNTIPYLCHYVLTSGILNFQGDCTHSLCGQKVPLPNLPEGLIEE